MGYFSNKRGDIQAVLDRDPAARGRFEVVTCYPGYKALRAHRRAHWLWNHGLLWLARWLSYRSAVRTGIEIHPAAKVGQRLFIDHGNGIVIGATAEIGDDVTLYQGTTLGGTGKEIGKRHPTIGNGVTIGAGAKILGPFTVGAGSKIGAGSVVLREVPPDSTVVGNPGRVVRLAGQRIQEQLPDPVKECIDTIIERINKMECCIQRAREDLPCEDCPDFGCKDCYTTQGGLKHADL